MIDVAVWEKHVGWRWGWQTYMGYFSIDIGRLNIAFRYSDAYTWLKKLFLLKIN